MREMDEASQAAHEAWLAYAVVQVAKTALAGDLDAACGHLNAISGRYGLAGEYTLCCGLVELLMMRDGMVPAAAVAEGAFYGFLIQGEEDEEGWLDPDAVAAEGVETASVVRAARFATAHLNGDEGQKRAIFDACQDQQQAASLILGLLRLLNGGPLPLPEPQ